MAQAKTDPGSEIVQIPEPGPMVLAALGKGPIPDPASQGAVERIRLAIIAAESPEALIDAGKAVSAADILGVPIEVHDFDLRESTMGGEGLGVFAVCDAIRGDNGDQFVFTTSAENVVLRLCVAKDRNWLPLRFKIEKADRETARGFTPYVVKAV